MRRVRAEREIQRIADVDLRVAIGNLLQRMELSAGQRDPRGAVQHDHGGIGLAVEATGIRVHGRGRRGLRCCGWGGGVRGGGGARSEEHTSELQSLIRISYAVFCLQKKKTPNTKIQNKTIINPQKYCVSLLYQP